MDSREWGHSMTNCAITYLRCFDMQNATVYSPLVSAWLQ